MLEDHMRALSMTDFMKEFPRLLMSVLFVTAPLASVSWAQTPVVVSEAQAEQHITVEGVVTAVTTSRKGNTFIISAASTRTRHLPVGFQLGRHWRASSRIESRGAGTSLF